MMKRTLIALFVTILILAACEQKTATPIVIKEAPTPSLASSQTLFPNETQSPVHTQQPSPEPRQTPSPGVLSRWTEIYPTKKVLVFYGVASNTFVTSMFITSGQNFDINPRLILYTDGQLIIGNHEIRLSQKEIDEILTKFEQLGFYQINGTAPIDEQNPIYTFPNGIAPNLFGHRTVKSIEVDGHKTNVVGFMVGWEEFLIQPVKDIVTYLESLSTEGMSRYQPDRLLVGIVFIHVTNDGQKFMPWPEDITHPSGIENEGVLYLEGNEATKLYNLWLDNPDIDFIYKETKFWIIPRPIYPHECQTSSFSFLNWIPTDRPYFFCDDP